MVKHVHILYVLFVLHFFAFANLQYSQVYIHASLNLHIFVFLRYRYLAALAQDSIFRQGEPQWPWSKNLQCMVQYSSPFAFHVVISSWPTVTLTWWCLGSGTASLSKSWSRPCGNTTWPSPSPSKCWTRQRWVAGHRCRPPPKTAPRPFKISSYTVVLSSPSVESNGRLSQKEHFVSQDYHMARQLWMYSCRYIYY